jgi:hypothetical protein
MILNFFSKIIGEKSGAFDSKHCYLNSEEMD